MFRERIVRVGLGFVLAMAATAAMGEPQLICRMVARPNYDWVQSKYKVKLRGTTPGAPFALFGVPRGVDVATVQAAMAKDRYVVWVEDNAEVSSPENQGGAKSITPFAIGGRSDLYAQNTHALEQVNWSDSLANSNGRAVRLAIIDTGLSPNQQYLWDKVVASTNVVEPGQPAFDLPTNQDSNGNFVFDEGAGHGTMVAGIADQIAPKVNFVIARVADSDGLASAWSIVQGLAFAAVNGAEVANVSLGSPNAIVALSDVMDWCDEEQGMVVVSAIGNTNSGDAWYPSRIHKVICVSGVLPDNKKAPFSNYDGKCESTAPATGFVSQDWDGGMETWSGTSFSTPMVSAAIADVLRRTTHVLPGTIQNAVADSGTDIDSLNPGFRGKLGTLLNIVALDKAIRGPGKGR